VEEWLGVIYPKKDWKRVPVKQLWAVYFNIREGMNKKNKEVSK
jgi:hypothetical protein